MRHSIERVIDRMSVRGIQAFPHAVHAEAAYMYGVRPKPSMMYLGFWWMNAVIECTD
jgi:hypothetical protein